MKALLFAALLLFTTFSLHAQTSVAKIDAAAVSTAGLALLIAVNAVGTLRVAGISNVVSFGILTLMGFPLCRNDKTRSVAGSGFAQWANYLAVALFRNTAVLISLKGQARFGANDDAGKAAGRTAGMLFQIPLRNLTRRRPFSAGGADAPFAGNNLVAVVPGVIIGRLIQPL